MNDFEEEVIQAFKDNRIPLSDEDAIRAARVVESVFDSRRLQLLGEQV